MKWRHVITYFIPGLLQGSSEDTGAYVYCMVKCFLGFSQNWEQAEVVGWKNNF